MAKKLKVKIPLIDYLSVGKQLEVGQILYLQNVNCDNDYIYFIDMQKYVYFKNGKRTGSLMCQRYQQYLDSTNLDIISLDFENLFIEVEIKI